MENNFKCIKCGHEFLISEYIISYCTLGLLFKNKKNKERIVCPVCKCEEIESIINKGEVCTNFGKFNSMSDDDKKSLLKKRANEHQKKNIKERKREIDKAVFKKMIQ